MKSTSDSTIDVTNLLYVKLWIFKIDHYIHFFNVKNKIIIEITIPLLKNKTK